MMISSTPPVTEALTLALYISLQQKLRGALQYLWWWKLPPEHRTFGGLGLKPAWSHRHTCMHAAHPDALPHDLQSYNVAVHQRCDPPHGTGADKEHQINQSNQKRSRAQPAISNPIEDIVLSLWMSLKCVWNLIKGGIKAKLLWTQKPWQRRLAMLNSLCLGILNIQASIIFQKDKDFGNWMLSSCSEHQKPKQNTFFQQKQRIKVQYVNSKSVNSVHRFSAAIEQVVLILLCESVCVEVYVLSWWNVVIVRTTVKATKHRHPSTE